MHSLCQRSNFLLLASIALTCSGLISPAAAQVMDWAAFTAQHYIGNGTVYGADQNLAGACAYGTNFANTYQYPWSLYNATNPTTYIAIDRPLFMGSATCGSCLWMRGTGQGIGVSGKEIPQTWQYAVVDNECPECPAPNLDLARSYDVGDGIWQIDWYIVPCQVGNTKLHYYMRPNSNPYFLQIVVSNGRVPVKSGEYQVTGVWIPARRESNNMWSYNAQYTLPIPVRITPVCGAAVYDTINSLAGGYGGKVQFGVNGCFDRGPPWAQNPTGKPSLPPSSAVLTPPRPPPPRPPPPQRPPPSAAPQLWPYATDFFCTLLVTGSGWNVIGSLASASLACSSRRAGAVLTVTGGQLLRAAYSARPIAWTGVKLVEASTDNQFGPGNGDASLQFSGASVTLSGSVSRVVNAASPAVSIVDGSLAILQQIVCSSVRVASGAACLSISGSTVNMFSSTFITNTVTGQGAAVTAVDSTIALLNNTVFQTNNATSGSFFSQGSSVQVNSAQFLYNVSPSGVGGAGATLVGCPASRSGGASSIRSSLFSGNYAVGGFGGAVRVSGCSGVSIGITIFSSNFAKQAGGAVYLAGCGGSTTAFAGAQFVRNSDGTGGASASEDIATDSSCSAVFTAK